MYQIADIKLWKTNKGSEIVDMDSNKYYEECLKRLNVKQFVKLEKGPTKNNTGKAQRMLRKIKSKER